MPRAGPHCLTTTYRVLVPRTHSVRVDFAAGATNHGVGTNGASAGASTDHILAAVGDDQSTSIAASGNRGSPLLDPTLLLTHCLAPNDHLVRGLHINQTSMSSAEYDYNELRDEEELLHMDAPVRHHMDAGLMESTTDKVVRYRCVLGYVDVRCYYTPAMPAMILPVDIPSLPQGSPVGRGLQPGRVLLTLHAHHIHRAPGHNCPF